MRLIIVSKNLLMIMKISSVEARKCQSSLLQSN